MDSSSSGAASTVRESIFDCNICLECPADPVVTFCGHLFCWSCLYKWLNEVSLSQSTCPVCKSLVSRERIIPLYGRGKIPQNYGMKSGQPIPDRPSGQRYISQVSSRGRNPSVQTHSFPQPPQSSGFSGVGFLSSLFGSVGLMVASIQI